MVTEPAFPEIEPVMVWEKVLWSVRRVEEAAEMVMELPRSRFVPLMEPRDPERRLVPIVVVAMSWLFSLSARSAEALCPVSHSLAAVRLVVEAFGKVLSADVEVAVNVGAVMVLYAVAVPRKREEPKTSNMLPLVVVAASPSRKTLEMVEGWMARESVVVAKRPAAPAEVRSVCHEGKPPTSLRTNPSVLLGRDAREFAPLAYMMSPEEKVPRPVPPCETPRVPAMRFAPIEEDAITFPLSSVARMPFVSPVNQAVVRVVSVDELLAKIWSLLQVLPS
ncbi:MAG: hypothetical protein KGI06_06370, partial [Candidatus Micrarchaeota archaeon]|nr:hypothetical protein [Candidatus Micrarchaeota archaeon]